MLPRRKLTPLPAAVCSPIEWTVDASLASSVLSLHGVVALRRPLSPDVCERWVKGTYGARASWTADFGDDQFSLGRAFYTHLEQDRTAAYFRDAATSDARVEQHAPGLQSAMHALAVTVTGGQVRARRGWCGPGIHVFPAHGHVATHGGVVHFDTEGLTEHHLSRGARALSVVCMLQPPSVGGGLRVWDVLYEGDDHPEDDDLETESVMAVYEVGDVVVFDSYRLHQIQPFGGEQDRISVTVHLAEVDDGHWESWF